jgi:diacylglycerol kinase family enzyme
VAGIGVVVNPHAKGNRGESGARERRMATILGTDGLVRVTATLEAVDEVAHEFVERGIDILAICGGDGSDHCTLTVFHRVYGGRPLPLLLPLRAGTINYIADATAGRRGTPEQVLARVLRDYRRGHTHVTTERDVLRVAAGAQTELGFLLSFGTTVNFLRAYYALEQQGPWPATKLLGRVMASAVFGTHISRAVFQAVEADIECDDEPLPFRRFTFFFAATVDQIALGIGRSTAGVPFGEEEKLAHLIFVVAVPQQMVNDAGVRGSTQCAREGLAPRCSRASSADLLHHNQCVVDCPHARRHPRRLFGAFTRVPGPDRAFKCH